MIFVGILQVLIFNFRKFRILEILNFRPWNSANCIFIYTEEEETSILWKALAIRLEKYFNFARIYKPSVDDLKSLGLKEFFVAPPALFVIVSEDERFTKVNAIHYETAKQGIMNYTNVMTFLFVINSEYRYNLPGDNQSNQKTEAEMEDVILIEAERFDIKVQGRNRSLKEDKEEQTDTIAFKSTEETAPHLSKDEL